MRATPFAFVALLLAAHGHAGDVAVRGRLVDGDTGAAISGTLEVAVVEDDDARLARRAAGPAAPPSRRVPTAPDGTWVVSLPRSPTEHRIVALSPGRGPVLVKELVALGRDLTVDAVPLSAGGVIRGRARRAGDGQPVAGATVELQPRDEGRQAYPRAALRTVTGPDGGYRLDGVSLQGGQLVVRAAGLASLRRDVPGPRPGSHVDVDVDLEPGTSVRGVVRRAASGAVAGAWVEDLSDPGGPAARTAADGSFTLHGLARGDVLIQARAGGSRPGTWRGALPREDGAPVEIRLSPGGTLRLSLWDEVTGDAIEGARLAPDRRQLPPALTDAMGEACWESVPPDAVEVVADARGYAVESVGPIHVPSGGELRLSVAMRRTAVLEGVAVESSGAPIAGAIVRAGRSRELQGGGLMPFVPLPRPGTETDSRGTFVLEDLEAAPVFLELRASGFARKEVRLGSLADGEVRRGMRLEMSRGGRLRGVVMGADGRPAGGVSVTARLVAATPKRHARAEAAEPLARTVTDASGAYDLGALPQGAIEIQATKGVATVRATAMALAGEAMEVDTVTLPTPAGGPRVVTVRDARGRPLAGATVTARSPDGRSQTAVPDGPGRYLLADVALGATVPVSISVPEHGRLEIESRPSQDVEAVVTPQPRLGGRVLDDGGGPVTAYTLEIAGPEGSGFRTTLRVDDPDGQFEVAVEPGLVDLQVKAAGRLDTVARSVPVPEPPADAPPVALEMRRGAAISGWLLDGDGIPVDHGRVRSSAEDVTIRGRAYRGAAQEAVTGADGWFRLSGLRSGTTEITAEAPSHPSLRVDLPAGNQGTDGIVLQLPVGATLPGVVLLPDGSPARSARVTVYDGRRILRRIATDETGEFLLAGLPLSALEVDAELVNGARSAREPLVLARRDPPPSILRIRAGLSVEGRILGVPGDALTRITVLALSPKGSWTAPVDATGAFVLADVPPGDVMVSATLPEDAGGRSVRRAVRVAWGEAPPAVELDFAAAP